MQWGRAGRAFLVLSRLSRKSPLRRKKNLRGIRHLRGFREAARIRWEGLYGDAEWGPCECGCGRWISKDTVPHHIGEGQGGLGGKRVHDPDLMRFYASGCHDAAHGIRRVA